MSYVKDTIEAYEIGFAKGRAHAMDLHLTELAINRVKKDQEVRNAYNSGFNAGRETAPAPAVNDHRTLTKINAIKLVRERFSLSLKDGLDLIEEIWTASNIKFTPTYLEKT